MGIRTLDVTGAKGGFYLLGCEFNGCSKGLVSTMNGSFFIRDNIFNVKKPTDCPDDNGAEMKGVELSGETLGFAFSNNTFTYDGPLDPFPAEILIGTDCTGLGDGMGNTIEKNHYEKLHIGNRASGDNGGIPDGLIYLCNTNANKFGMPPTDFLIRNGTVRQLQGLPTADFQTPVLPAGNIFSPGGANKVYTFNNLGANTVDYYYQAGEPSQYPGDDGGGYFYPPEGVNAIEINAVNERCQQTIPCSPYPCSSENLAAVKSHFHQQKQSWTSKKALLPGITNEAEWQQTVQEIRMLRLGMNQDVNKVLLHYNLDTTGILVDSIETWLRYAETYSADLRLLGYYFFSDRFGRFDTLKSEIPSKFELDEGQLNEYNHLLEVYDTIRGHVQANGHAERLSGEILQMLRDRAPLCEKAGFFSSALLRLNGVDLTPDCSGNAGRPAITATFAAENLDHKEVSFFPNPAHETLQISMPASVEARVLQIVDLNGILVWNGIVPPLTTQFTIPVRSFAGGLYFAKILGNPPSRHFGKILISH